MVGYFKQADGNLVGQKTAASNIKIQVLTIQPRTKHLGTPKEGNGTEGPVASASGNQWKRLLKCGG